MLYNSIIIMTPVCHIWEIIQYNYIGVYFESSLVIFYICKYEGNIANYVEKYKDTLLKKYNIEDSTGAYKY